MEDKVPTQEELAEMLDKEYQAALERVQVKKHSATYELPYYEVTDRGLEKYPKQITLPYVKMNVEGQIDMRQPGVIGEDIIAMQIVHLKSLNVGKWKNEYSDKAIEHLELALKEILKRVVERKARGVFAKDQK